jgi:plastocyanin
MKFYLLLLTALPAMAVAQYGSPADSTTSSSTAPATATSSSSSSLQTVTVGNGGNIMFSPDSITAKAGEQIVFSWGSSGHSVTQGSFDTPCQPLNGTGVNSGFVNTPSAQSVRYVPVKACSISANPYRVIVPGFHGDSQQH